MFETLRRRLAKAIMPKETGPEYITPGDLERIEREWQDRGLIV